METGYKGQIYPIRFSGATLHTDDPQNIISPTNLIYANNISTDSGSITKERGSRVWNQVVIPVGVVRAIEWKPSDTKTRMICASTDGKIYRFKDAYNITEVFPATSSVPSLINTKRFISFISGGEELSGNDKKLFIFSEGSQPQVIVGDGITRRSLTKPSVDWTGLNNPFFGIIHRSSLWTIGNGNMVYKSKYDDHEDFQTTGTGSAYAKQFSVAPGEGTRVISAFVSKGKLFFIKDPFGIYYLEDSSATTTDWEIIKVTGEIGSHHPNCVLPIMDDIVVANNLGFITSLKNIYYSNDLKGSDLLSVLRCSKSVKQNASISDQSLRDSVYYSDKKIALFSYKDSSSTGFKVLKIDFLRQQPSVSWSSKDQVRSLGLRTHSDGINRPFYVSSNATGGYIYDLDTSDYNVDGSYYRSEFRLPPIDMNLANPVLAEYVKSFEFLEILYIPTGYFKVYVDVYVDFQLQETVDFQLEPQNYLNTMTISASASGVLAQSCRIESETPASIKIPISGTGRRISLHVWQEGSGDSFIINGFNIYYDVGSNQQYKAKVD